MRRQLAGTFRAVLVSTLTTGTAFGTPVAGHTRAFGELALVTMSIGTVVNLLWLPVSLWPERTSAAAPPLEPPASEA
jgi:hypothetical protein